MRTIGCIGLKGGAGRTTVAVNLAAALARKRGPVVLIDTDLQRSAAAWLPSSEAVRVEPVPELARLRALLDQEWRGLVVVDGRPADLELCRAVVELAALVLVPMRCSALDLHANRPVLELLEGRRALVVPCMVPPRSADLGPFLDAVRGLGLRVSESVLHARIAHMRAPLARCAVIDYEPHGAAASEVLALADEVDNLLHRR